MELTNKPTDPGRFKTIYRVENPDLPIDKDFKPKLVFTIKPTPLMNDMLLEGITVPHEPPYTDQELAHMVQHKRPMTPEQVRDFYEAKRASGELRVVKRIPRSEAKQHVLLCNEQMYDAMDAHFEDYIDFCPGCGASIVDT
jgi:hypothetical protein